MKIKLMTDAPKHNLALMKLSTWHKSRGDEVFIGKPQDECDISYGSWLFSQRYPINISGGTGTDRPWDRLDNYSGAEVCKPDYSLYPKLGYSLGYTWEYCPRKCGFCVVPKQKLSKYHMSIYEFLNPEYKKICLLNNNTFTDPYWRETFQEVLDANLVMIDENGYDLRLLDDEKIFWLNKINFDGIVHFSWDCIEDEVKIREGLSILKRLNHRIQIYVLVGYPDWRPIGETDIARCQIINEYGFDPYIMVYNRHIDGSSPKMRLLNRYQRMVNRTFLWRKYGFKKAWEEYR